MTHKNSNQTAFGRRSIVRGAAWAVPAATVATVAPAFASSPSVCEPEQYYTKARIVTTDPDYSNNNYDAKVTLADTPQGNFEMQHWYANGVVHWRLAVGAIQGAEAGATVTIPFDPSWTFTNIEQLGLGDANGEGFARFMPGLVDGGSYLYEQSLPNGTASVTSAGISITFNEEIAPKSAGMFHITATPNYSDEQVRNGCTLTAEATMKFTPVDCVTRFPEPQSHSEVPPTTTPEPEPEDTCTENFTWCTTGVTQGTSSDITRYKQQPTGEGDCSDVSIDYWITRTPVTFDNGDQGYAFTPHYRVIVGTQIAIDNVVATFSSPDGSVSFDPESVQSVRTPANGAVPSIYKVNTVDPLAQPEPAADGSKVTWNLGSMPAQSSAAYAINGETFYGYGPEYANCGFITRLTVTGEKECDAAPVACP